MVTQYFLWASEFNTLHLRKCYHHHGTISVKGFDLRCATREGGFRREVRGRGDKKFIPNCVL